LITFNILILKGKQRFNSTDLLDNVKLTIVPKKTCGNTGASTVGSFNYCPTRLVGMAYSTQSCALQVTGSEVKQKKTMPFPEF
jgi:hypothetical protein